MKPMPKAPKYPCDIYDPAKGDPKHDIPVLPITSTFAILNLYDDKSYVIASAVSELYALTMMSLVGYLTHYLAWRKAKSAE